MKTFSINTLGCKVNQYESQQIRQLLEQLGLSMSETAGKADLVVINTCCVTHTASAKSRQNIRKTQKLSPDAVIVVSGCLPSVQLDELSNPGENVHLINHRESLPATLAQIIGVKTASCGSESPKSCKYNRSNQLKLPQLTHFRGHTRAFLKIQDGCDGFCSYCIVPKTRPFVHSKPPETVLEEAQALVKSGHKEIVVTGIFLGAYGQSSVKRKTWPSQLNEKLAEIIDKMAKIPNLARIRLSSLEPTDVTPRLLDIFSNNRNIMPHLHLSLQSGSNAILKRMARQYDVEEFRDKVKSIKSRLDRPAITTDIIVGFPGETDDDFEKTINVARDVGFAKMHIFSFSPRKGTPAATMQDTVDNRVIKKRIQVLCDLNNQLESKFREQFIGETATILTENSDQHPCGRSERYFMVYLEKGTTKLEKNQLIRVKLIRNAENSLVGKLNTPKKG
ncbi:MAG: tRNA (N(6)-L-threonylcarbamoyladenosine(37)-C(2))-methylthiotransferase MtaB [Phycisphaerae bacterium]|nr:tRNA (N(6)-L-threonylcarbamoyladenosine(37)-C(2))-methylthiotransferase MtaB [Phycisphaerae bacterium]NIP50780.1 tRNA (N(6)-L-threonylcarbamoyladenosine(37)-C(2))-methylthiotransferase MtaB [Phycisphaerae bacterium]NIS49944.1 tRNA (N(6)-L-threonylcarbamoyladenosine(37)-C(2))-methylthiotransferase MtaB [Phycisphaerae bacterium]NIU07648.1 tRNA (N(6)-L-threonylcarbamoyladenosine(37)-C(2))-methylthiotransferase MtaB [Phycisphaerae bacterium]NIU57430.1 tRNA (N(6)-L-threonylcarbamoyladenosine(37)-